MLQIGGIIACVLSVVAFLPYIRDTISGNTRPERASWLIWSVLSTISFFSQVYEGAGISLLFSGELSRNENGDAGISSVSSRGDDTAIFM